MTEIEWKTDEEYLRMIAYLMDTSFDQLDDLTRGGEEELTKTIVNHIECFVGYFTNLTIKALDDKELADEIGSTFSKLVPRSKNFDSFFGILTRILCDKHLDDLPKFKNTPTPERIGKVLQVYEENNMIERIGERYKKWEESQLKRQRPKEPTTNIMYG